MRKRENMIETERMGGEERGRKRGRRDRERGVFGLLMSQMTGLINVQHTFSYQSLGPGEWNTRSCVYPESGDGVS